ncbi:MAG: alpha/beta hydrolase [Opitutae bacterium]|nr:alpha/beta hydrolase [Opitutae bacterium]
MSTTCEKNMESVVLLHGLSRTSRSMRPIKKVLEKNGYSTFNLNYPSRKKPIEELSEYVRQKIHQNFSDQPPKTLHFVTHSMGGIILRQIMKSSPLPNLARVVMLGPPNQGSEIIDKLARFKLIPLINGPACLQLGTSPDGFVQSLGPVHFELGVIAGTKSINPFLSFLIPGQDDGKVSVERTKIKGMNDFYLVHKSHSFMMGNKKVQNETISFLQNGKFSKNNP